MFEKFLIFITIIILIRFAIPLFFGLVGILLYGVRDIGDKFINKTGFLRDDTEVAINVIVAIVVLISGSVIIGAIIKILEVIY